MPRRSARGFRDQWIQFLRGSVLVSPANTFTQTTLALPTVVSQGLVLEMLDVEFAFESLAGSEISQTDDSLTIQVQLTKASKTAMLVLSDPDLLAAYEVNFQSPSARTAEKAPVIEINPMGSLYRAFPAPILLPFEQIYLGARTAGIATGPTLRVKIGYLTTRLATNQLVELIQAIT